MSVTFSKRERRTLHDHNIMTEVHVSIRRSAYQHINLLIKYSVPAGSEPGSLIQRHFVKRLIDAHRGSPTM